MRLISRTLLALGLLSMVCGGLGADARASTGRLWVGSFTAGVRPRGLPPVEILVPLAEGGFGVTLAFEKTTGNGHGADHHRTIPVAQMESFFSHNRLTGVLIESHQGDSSGTMIYVPDETLWDELAASEALERFSVVLATASALMAGADLPSVDGLAPFAMDPVDSGDLKEIFFLADGEPNSGPDGWSPFTLEVISNRPLEFAEEDLISEDSYLLLDPADFGENPFISSRPVFGVRTPGEVYDVWLYPAVTDDDEWVATRAALKEAVELSSTQPLAPLRSLRGRTDPPPGLD